MNDIRTINGYAIKPGADLREAQLQLADLSEADLCEANLHGANLFMADLSGANLTMASLIGAEVALADLSEAEGLEVEQVKEAKHWDEATYDDHFRSKLGLPPEE